MLATFVVLAILGALVAVVTQSGCAHAPASQPGYHFTAADGGYVFTPAK